MKRELFNMLLLGSMLRSDFSPNRIESNRAPQMIGLFLSKSKRRLIKSNISKVTKKFRKKRNIINKIAKMSRKANR